MNDREGRELVWFGWHVVFRRENNGRLKSLIVAKLQKTMNETLRILKFYCVGRRALFKF